MLPINSNQFLGETMLQDFETSPEPSITSNGNQPELPKSGSTWTSQTARSSNTQSLHQTADKPCNNVGTIWKTRT